MSLLVGPKFMGFDSAGDPLSGGKLYTYAAGTTTAKVAYTDPTLLVAHANPIILDSRGEALVYFNGTYKLILTTSADVAVWTVDNVEGSGSINVTKLSSYADLVTAVSTIGATESTLYIDKDDTMTANVIIPTTLQLHFLKGNMISTTGYTLTFSGSPGSVIARPDQQIFSGTGTVTFTYGGTVYPEWWGAKGDGATNDSVNINYAINSIASGGIVVFQPKTYMCNITLQSNITLQGSGIYATVLKAPAGSEADVIKGYLFDSLTGTAKATPETRGVNFTCIRDLTVDGNKANNAAGYGIRVWGKCMNWDSVFVMNCSNDGIWTEWTTHDIPSGPPGGDTEDPRILIGNESIFKHIYTAGNDGHGWSLRGPHDSYITMFSTFSNGGWGLHKSGTYCALSGSLWNSYVNTTGSFYLGDGGYFDKLVASQIYNGIGIQLVAASSGNYNIINGIIAAHETGLMMEGSNNLFQGQISRCSNAAIASATAGDAVIITSAINCTVDVFGDNNFNGIKWVSETGVNKVWARFAVPVGKTLYTGTPGATCDFRLQDTLTIANSRMSNPPNEALITLTPDSVTPSILMGTSFKTANTVATAYTGFSDATVGKRFTILFGDANSTIPGNGLYMKGNGGTNWSPEIGDWIDVIFDGSVFRWAKHDCTA